MPVITAVVLALAVVSCAGIVSVTQTSRMAAGFRFVADGVALATVAGDEAAADALAAARGCAYSVVARSNVAVTVRLDDSCGSVMASAALRP